MLDQQPLWFSRVAAGRTHQHPAPLQFFAGESEFDFTRAVCRLGIAVFGNPVAAVPDHDGAAAVLALGNGSFEVGVFDRVIFDLDRQTFLRGVEAGTLGDRPAFERAAHLQAKVVMQVAGGVLLHDETLALRNGP